MEWQQKLNIFLSDFEYIKDVTAVLACGSYVTGNPTTHSDLDVHIILDDGVNYRERGNKYVDGLLIEYFANPPRQILKYFAEDIIDKSLMSQVQFATGKIILDNKGEAAALKAKAGIMIADFYANATNVAKSEISVLTKYFLWDSLDNLQDAYKTGRSDFDFLYYTYLDRTLHVYMNTIKHPYNSMSILGNIQSQTVRDKYLLHSLPDENIANIIAAAITTTDKQDRLKLFAKLVTSIFNQFGGFCIDGFKFKSDVE